MLGNARPASASCDLSTRIYNFTAYESYGTVSIGGTLQYRNSSQWYALTGSKVTFYWYQQLTTGSNPTSTPTTYIGQVYSDDRDGTFYFVWYHHGLEPGLYHVVGTYQGGDSVGSHTTCANGTPPDDTTLLIQLRLTMTISSPTVSVAQGDSTSVTVTVKADNSNNAHPLSLSVQGPGNLFATETFSPSSGSTPLVSKLTLNVLNVTQPGIYQIVIIATSQEDSSVTVRTPLQILVQQNTHTITIEIQGLPPDVATSLYFDGSFVGKLGSGTEDLTISNKTRVVSVSKQIVSGDTLYSCQAYSMAADTGVTSFTFKYDTLYRLKISGDLPQSIVSKLVLVVDGKDRTDSAFKPAQGFSDFLPQNAHVSFAIMPSYITTDVVNYKFREWKDLTTSVLTKASNATADGLYEVTLTRPYFLVAGYDKWVVVTIKANLPSDMSTKLQIGMAGSENKSVSVVGSVPYSAGEFMVGSAFQCAVGQDQFVLFNTGGNIRYEFQGMTPSSPTTLDKHTTININYAVKYKVQVISKFADAIVQPAGGVGWFASGQIATLQVKEETNDKNGIPYIFDGWTGAIKSNKTIISFPVTAPIQVEVQWKPNWTYLLTLGGVLLGISAPSAVIIKRKLRRIRPFKKRVPKLHDEATKRNPADADLELYNYIIERGGSISLSNAMEELGMTREEINQSIRRLKETQLLR
jgi:hypothetical protein